MPMPRMYPNRYYGGRTVPKVVLRAKIVAEQDSMGVRCWESFEANLRIWHRSRQFVNDAGVIA
jgi:hypothetical protein